MSWWWIMWNAFPFRIDCRTVVAACAVLACGCAARTPERAASRLIRDLRSGAAAASGPDAFERVRAGLRLQEQPAKRATAAIYTRSANWNRGGERIGIVSSEVLRDAPGRFDLRLAWTPARPLRPRFLEGLLGKPWGKSGTWDDGWIVAGGMLEYRVAAGGTPYLLFSSPGYVGDPLDLMESAALPGMPDLATVNRYPAHNGITVTPHAAVGPGKVPYLAGLTISISNRDGVEAKAPEFVPVLRDLRIASPDEVAAAIFRTGTFAVYRNFALALEHGPADTTVGIWRRIESPRAWCEHLRPDLERCSVN